MSSQVPSLSPEDKIVTKYLAHQYAVNLAWKDTPNPKALVLFSGVVASGKTSIARELERQLRGIRISNDDLRQQIMELKPVPSRDRREDLLMECMRVVSQLALDWPNGLIIIDASCDRKYEFYQRWAQNHDYEIIVLRMDIPRAEIERRLEARSALNHQHASVLLPHLDLWWQQYEDFAKNHKIDMVINQHTSTEEIVKFLQTKLHVMTGSHRPKELVHGKPGHEI